MSSNKTKITIIVEVKDGILWGIVEPMGNFIATPYGKTKDDVISNLKELITGYKLNEGKKDKFWKTISVDQLEFEIQFDLQAFFREFSELKISSIAERARLNPSLVRQYATGNKFPSPEQVKKIEHAVHHLGRKLKNVNIYAE